MPRIRFTDAAPVADTVDAFCRRWSISRTTYLRMQRDGTGPTEVIVGERPRITLEAEQAWAKRRESNGR